MTSPEIVRKDWLRSGIGEDMVNANSKGIQMEASRLLDEWIYAFVTSFRKSPLRSILEKAFYLRLEASLYRDGPKWSGLAVFIRPTTLDEFKFLLHKTNTLRYRLKKIDPESQILIISTPNCTGSIATNLATGEMIAVRGKEAANV
jgi:hypothetical protein